MPLTIVFTAPGNYTIEDDGIRGNNISVVRDSNGVVIDTFVHPGDALSFVTITPGVHLTFNVADTFGTATVNVGVLGDPAASPDSIVVRSLRTDAFVTLASNGSIVEGGADASADISAAGLVLSAGTGVGTGANALETQVTFIEAEASTGGINILNAGSVQIGGLSPDVNGLDVATSGNINFSTTGFILLADSTGGQSVHGGDISGNVTLTAIGADADIFSNINQQVIRAPGGGVTLNAGRDIIFGTSGTNFNNDILATNAIVIRAGRDFQLDGTSNIRTGAFGGVFGGAIDIQAGRNINLSSSTGGLQTIEAFQGDVILTTGPGGVFFENAAFPGAVQTNQNIILTADNVQINSGGLNTTGIGSVTIRPVTPGRAIDLGTALDSPSALGLSDAEFDLLFTLNVNIGSADSGNVDFSAPLSPFIVDNLTVQSGNDILFRSTLTLPRALVLRAGDDLYFSPGASFTSTNEGLTAFVDNAQDDDGLGGLGQLDGTLSVNTAIQLNGNLDADTLNGSGAGETLLGNGGNDILRGFGGNDSLNGGAGSDSMNGGLGDDFLFVDLGSDTVLEAVGEGNDRVFTSVSYTLTAGASIELFTTTNGAATTALNLTGNALAQTIYGNAGANSLDGGGGGDTLVGLGGNDFYFIRNSADRAVESAGAGADRVFAAASFALEANSSVEIIGTINQAATTAINLSGNALTQSIVGNAGANTLDSGGGNDVMQGLGGDDFYIVRAAGDRAAESAGGGNDRVFAALSFVLEAGSSIEILSTTNNAGLAAINLTGNALTQSIAGNAGANTLDSGGGGDVMQGLAGDDFYYIRSSSDRAVEAAAAGNDRVFAAVNFALENNSAVEIIGTISQAAATAINLTGNNLAQTIVGNAGANTLDSGGGGDTMIGLGGNDFYMIRAAGDRASESAGNGSDRVFAAVSFILENNSEVEILSTIFNAAVDPINLTGNALAQSVFGNDGANTLDGKGGLDTLTGFAGADSFAFTTALGAGNVDSISDFQAGIDEIVLENAIFTGLAGGALPASAFTTGSATTADHRILYNNSTGALFFDADGNGAGAAVHFATLQGVPVISAGDFTVI